MRSLPTEALSPHRLEKLEALLDADERATAARRVRATDRRDTVAAHGLLKELLGDWLGVAPADCRLRYGAAGEKPRLAKSSCHGIDVSMTHCDGLAACAAGLAGSVGIDAEPLDMNVDVALAADIFSTGEQRWLRCQPEGEVRANFLRLWTLKEAVIKADGRGLSLPLASFTLLPDPPRMIDAPSWMGAPSRWSLRQWMPTPRHIAAFAYRT